jgi:hypothetical protein
MNTKMITKRLWFRLTRPRNRDLPLTGLTSRLPTSEVRRNILKKLSLRLNKKLLSSS